MTGVELHSEQQTI